MAEQHTLAERPPVSPFVGNIINPLMAALLRSPLHGVLSKQAILLTFKGRKTGKVYHLPVGYYDLQGDSLVVIPLHRWWKNLQNNAPVTVWLKGRQYQGVANASQGDEASVKLLQGIITSSANLMRVHQVEKDANGQPKLDSARRIAQGLVLVRIQFTSS